MALEKIELDKKLLQYSLSQFRNIPEYVAICEAIAKGMGTIQDGVDYLSDMIDIDKAEGVWLDYIGWLVGAYRGEYIDTDKYFCVNQTGIDEFGNPTGDVNKSKFFYFPNSSIGGSGTTLSDDLFRGQIKAKIAYNNSKGTREDLIKIIKLLVNADHVIMTKVAPMQLSILLYGDNILTQNMRERIDSVLPNGISLVAEPDILEISYTDIEKAVNEVLELDYISPLDQDYTYELINDDLNEILEINNGNDNL